MSETRPKEKLGLGLILKSASLLVFIAVLTFLTAGRLDYWPGWAYNGLNILFILITYIVLRDRKDLIKERLRPGEGMKKWDKVYWLISALLYFAMFFTSILDAGRLHETQPVPLIGILCGGLVFSLGQILVLWAKRANRFFSAVVRIQEDRGQIVCSDGPYRFVRHPGYLGGLLYTLVTPLLLGSYWGLIPAILIMIPLLVRTRLEDRTLQDELAGYADYARKVPYRLVPRIW